MAKLLEATSGRSDCKQVEQLDILHKVMFQTIQRKIGRGKKAYYEKEFKYNDEDDDKVRENIIYSIKYYKERCSNSDHTNGK
mgnify:CR=1 FL=1